MPRTRLASEQRVDEGRDRRALGQHHQAAEQHIMSRIGSSQNFFRTRMKRQSSARKAIALSLKLLFHTLSIGSWRLALDPVAVSRLRGADRCLPNSLMIIATGTTVRKNTDPITTSTTM